MDNQPNESTTELDIDLEKDEVSQLVDKNDEIDSLIAAVEESGGVNKQVVIDMESIEPNVILKKLPLNSFTQDYSFTNRKVTMEALEDMSDRTKFALMVGVGTFVGGLIAWIISRFFGGDSDDSGGGGGGGGAAEKVKETARHKEVMAKQEKQLQGILVDVQHQNRAQEAAYAAMVKDTGWDKIVGQIDTEAVTNKGTKIEDGIAAIYISQLRKGYCKLVDDLILKPQVHTSIAHHIVDNVPKWTKELNDKIALLKSGDGSKLDAESFKLNITLPGGSALGEDKAIQLASIYRDLSTPNKALKIPSYDKIEHTSFLGEVIDRMPANQEDTLKALSRDLEAHIQSLEHDTEKTKAQSVHFANLRRSVAEIGACYQILLKMVDTPKKTIESVVAAQKQKAEFLDRVCTEMKKASTEPDDKTIWQSCRDKLKEMLSSKPKP